MKIFKKKQKALSAIEQKFFKEYGALTKSSYPFIIKFYCTGYDITPEVLLRRCLLIKEVDQEPKPDPRFHMHFVATMANYGADDEETVKAFKKAYVTE